MYHALSKSELKDAVLFAIGNCPSQSDVDYVRQLEVNDKASYDLLIDTFVEQCIDLSNKAYVEDYVLPGSLDDGGYHGETFALAARYRDRTLFNRPIRMSDAVLVTVQVFSETVLPGLIGSFIARGGQVDELAINQLLVVGAMQVSIKMRKYLKQLLALPPFANEVERCLFIRAEVNFGRSADLKTDSKDERLGTFSTSQLRELYEGNKHCDTPFLRQWKCDVLYDASNEDTSLCGLAHDDNNRSLADAVNGLIAKGYFKCVGKREEDVLYIPPSLGRVAV